VTTAGRQITAVLTDALATKLHGDPRSEYRLEWTEEEQVKSLCRCASGWRKSFDPVILSEAKDLVRLKAQLVGEVKVLSRST
jgi:hypothetical protein